jgi:hypothetical protein
MKNMKNLVDSDYDYTESIKPITFKEVKQMIVDELENYEMDRSIDDPKVQKEIDMFAKRTMFNLNEQLMQMICEDDEYFVKISTNEFD